MVQLLNMDSKFEKVVNLIESLSKAMGRESPIPDDARELYEENDRATRRGGPVKHVFQFSGGLSSYEGAKRVARERGTEDLILLYTDTLSEDKDLYRFLIEAAASVYGKLTPEIRAIAAQAKDIPDEQEDTIAIRKQMIYSLRDQVKDLLPGLVWIMDGRTIWEVFHSVRFMGNSLFDPCSRILKRQLSDKWRKANCDPEKTILYLGYGYDEQNRIEKMLKAFAKKKVKWDVRFPMDLPPYLDRAALKQACWDSGIEIPRLYLAGFLHNNCGGRCVKAGLAAWRKTLNLRPNLYAYDERQEQIFRATVKMDSSILTVRDGGPKKRITLEQFRIKQEQGCIIDSIDFGGCSCFEPPEDENEDETEESMIATYAA